MQRALVLNSGLSWTAYQIGALRYLLIDRALHFDLCAGAGIGAVGAAFVACGEYTAFETFWKQFRPGRFLTSFNWRAPWHGLFTGTPQRRFLAAHLNEKKLEEQGKTLLVSTMNLQTGQELILRYPGSDLPLVDALMAAFATSGLFPPVRYQQQQLADASFINSFPLSAVLQESVEEILAVAATLPRGQRTQRRYTTWPVVLERTLNMNLSHKVWGALDAAEKKSAAATAFGQISTQLPARLSELIPSSPQREQLSAAISGRSSYPLKCAHGPCIKSITPSRVLDYPVWRFRERDLAAARAMGYQDARAFMAKEEVQVGR